MNNEPVAWMALNQLNNTYSAFTESDKERMLPHVQQLYANWIPLYTHPANKNPDLYMIDALNNTLNLERNHNEKAYKELYALCEKLAKENEALKAKTLTDEEIDAIVVGGNFRYRDFARAILRKAGEK